MFRMQLSQQAVFMQVQAPLKPIFTAHCSVFTALGCGAGGPGEGWFPALASHLHAGGHNAPVSVWPAWTDHTGLSLTCFSTPPHPKRGGTGTSIHWRRGSGQKGLLVPGALGFAGVPMRSRGSLSEHGRVLLQIAQSLPCLQTGGCTAEFSKSSVA